jgi:hypothetical protein
MFDVKASELVGHAQLVLSSTKDGEANRCLVFLVMNECCRCQDQALYSVSVNPGCGMPDLFQDFVSFPEPLLIEQIYSFSQRFALRSCRDSGLKGPERYDLGDLVFEKTLGLAEIG